MPRISGAQIAFVTAAGCTKQLLCCRRTARDVEVDRDDAMAAAILDLLGCRSIRLSLNTWLDHRSGPVWLPSELTALSVTTVSLVHAALGEQLASVIAACVNCYASIVAEFPTPEIVV
jgi:hypothetical protein